MTAIESHNETTTKTLFGFWTYLMTDCVLFAIFFFFFSVLHTGTYGGPSARDLFSLPFVLTQTLLLLTSSFTCGLMMLAAHQQRIAKTLAWSVVTFSLGLAFLAMELTEFHHFVEEGNSWARSAFLSAFFTLVGTHGLHITAGLLWIIVLIFQITARGLTVNTLRRLSCLSLFWHFLDVIWIFIFTIVYLMGVK